MALWLYGHWGWDRSWVMLLGLVCPAAGMVTDVQHVRNWSTSAHPGPLCWHS